MASKPDPRFPLSTTQMGSSAFLSKDDFEPGEQVTLTMAPAADGYGPVSVEGVPVPPSFKEHQDKDCLHFEETTKMLVLNKANRVAIRSELGKKTRAWNGAKVTLYVNPDVMFGNRKVGGIRIAVVGDGGAPVEPPEAETDSEDLGWDGGDDE